MKFADIIRSAAGIAFLLLFGLFSYLEFSTLWMLAMAGFMIVCLVDMVRERHDREAKNETERAKTSPKRLHFDRRDAVVYSISFVLVIVACAFIVLRITDCGRWFGVAAVCVALGWAQGRGHLSSPSRAGL